MIALGHLTTLDDRVYDVSWDEEGHRLALKRTVGDPQQLSLEVTDLLRDPKPWEGAALRVHIGDFYFAVVVADEERQRLRGVYLSFRRRRRERPSALAV